MSVDRPSGLGMPNQVAWPPFRAQLWADTLQYRGRGVGVVGWQARHAATGRRPTQPANPASPTQPPPRTPALPHTPFTPPTLLRPETLHPRSPVAKAERLDAERARDAEHSPAAVLQLSLLVALQVGGDLGQLQGVKAKGAGGGRVGGWGPWDSAGANGSGAGRAGVCARRARP